MILPTVESFRPSSSAICVGENHSSVMVGLNWGQGRVVGDPALHLRGKALEPVCPVLLLFGLSLPLPLLEALFLELESPHQSPLTLDPGVLR